MKNLKLADIKALLKIKQQIGPAPKPKIPYSTYEIFDGYKVVAHIYNGYVKYVPIASEQDHTALANIICHNWTPVDGTIIYLQFYSPKVYVSPDSVKSITPNVSLYAEDSTCSTTSPFRKDSSDMIYLRQSTARPLVYYKGMWYGANYKVDNQGHLVGENETKHGGPLLESTYTFEKFEPYSGNINNVLVTTDEIN